MGVVLGIGVGGDVEEHAWWNPIAAWRMLRIVESNPILQLSMPDVVAQVRESGAALLSVAGAGVGFGVNMIFNKAFGEAAGDDDEEGGERVKTKNRGRVGDARMEMRRIVGKLARTPPKSKKGESVPVQLLRSSAKEFARTPEQRRQRIVVEEEEEMSVERAHRRKEDVEEVVEFVSSGLAQQTRNNNLVVTSGRRGQRFLSFRPPTETRVVRVQDHPARRLSFDDVGEFGESLGPIRLQLG
jgi:hypothetical protein